MRTRRIAIRCRRTGRSATVAVGTGTGAPVDLPVPELPPGLVVPPGPGLDLPPLYGTLAAEHQDHVAPQQPGVAVPAYLSDRAHKTTESAPAEAVRRHDVDWDYNPGWPAGLGWTNIAQTARGRSPRHARGGGWRLPGGGWRLPGGRWRLPGPAVAWTGVGMLASAVLMLIAELLR